MLKTRIITALILLPLGVGIVIFAPKMLFAAIFSGVLVLASWEWAALIGLNGKAERLIFAAAALGLLAVTFWLGDWRWLAITALIVWLLLCLWLARPTFARGPGALSAGLKGGAGLATYTGALAGALMLRPEGEPGYLLFAMLAIVWAADTGAYFAGRQFGRRKLAPTISPGKTWAGLVGGVLSGIVAALVSGLLFKLSAQQLLLLSGIATGAVLLSIAGDLFVSLVKRQAGAKDTGSLLPGHGGILDRLDSTVAALPLLAIATHSLGLI